MKTPPMLMAAGMLFWGWQTGQFILAVIMALILEGARFVKVRWGFSAADFNRISDLTIPTKFCIKVLISSQFCVITTASLDGTALPGSHSGKVLNSKLEVCFDK